MAKTVFEFGIIEICNMNNLIEREQFWLNYFDLVTEGYNISLPLGTIMVLKGLRVRGKVRHLERKKATYFAEIAKRENLPLERRERMREAKLADKNPCHDKRWINKEGKINV